MILVHDRKSLVFLVEVPFHGSTTEGLGPASRGLEIGSCAILALVDDRKHLNEPRGPLRNIRFPLLADINNFGELTGVCQSCVAASLSEEVGRDSDHRSVIGDVWVADRSPILEGARSDY